MRKVLPLALLVTTLVVAPPAQASYRSCGDIARSGSGVYKVEARRVSCRHARWIARRFQSIVFEGASGRRGVIGGYRCRSRRIDVELRHARCTRSGGRVVRFEWGS